MIAAGRDHARGLAGGARRTCAWVGGRRAPNKDIPAGRPMKIILIVGSPV